MKTRLSIAIAALFGAASAHAGGLPVTDPILTALTKASWIKQVADMARQLQEAQKQLTQARATYDSMNGSRGISNLLRNPTLYNYLPPDAANALRVNTSSLSGTDAILANMKLLGIEQTSLDPKSPAGANFTARQASNANYQLLNDQAYQAADDRIKQLDAMIKSINGATDPMAINALSVRVAAEQGMIANEQARLMVLGNSAANIQRVQEQQSREIIMRSTRAPMPPGW
jgi:type IV secretion system protein VirB5